MALEAKDIEQHIEQIRDERREAANTAKRVGSTMMEIFKYVAAAVEAALSDIAGKYLSKEKDDFAKGIITFLQGINIDDIFKFDKDGNIIAYTIASPEFNENNKTGFAIAILDSDTGKYKLCVDEIAAWTKATVGQLLVEGNSIFNGDLSSPKFQSGFLDGFGWKIWGEGVPNAAGKLEQRYTGEIDNLIVRGTMRVFEMIISQLLGENDNRVFTGMLEVDHYDAESGKVYLDTKEGRMYNPFRKDDIIMVQQYNGMPSADNDYYVTKRYELIVTEVGSEGSDEDMLAWVKFRNFTSTMEGATPEKLIKKKDTFVRVDNLTDENRKGIVTITTVGPKTPYMDIIYGLKTDPDGALKGRLGNLQGITHPSFGQLKGFGELLQNLYAVGDLVLRRTGENIDTKFQVLSDLFSSNFTKTEYELTDDTNYLHNGQFMTSSADESIIDGWTIDDTDDTAFWVDPTTGMPVMVNGNASASGNRRVEIERTEGKQVLRLINCGITQKNALIDQPKTHKEYSNPSGKQNTKTDSAGNNAVTLNTATDGSVKDVQDTLYVSLRIYAITSGKLTVGFNGSTDVEGKDNTLKVRDITVPYSGEWTSIELNGKWNGTGDFVIRYTGDCRVAFVAITDTALDNLARTVSTSIEQTNEAIKLLGQNDDAIAGKYTSLGLVVDALHQQVDLFVNTTYPADKANIDSRIKINEQGIAALVTKTDDTNSRVSQLGINIDAVNERVDTFVNTTYPNDQKEIQRLISVNANGIDINTRDINSLTGTVNELGTSYDTLSKSVTTYANDYQNGYNTLNSRLTTAEGSISAHNTRIGTLENQEGSLDSRLSSAENNITKHSTRLTNAENNLANHSSRLTGAENDISGIKDKNNSQDDYLNSLNTEYSSLKSDFTAVQTYVTKMGVYFDKDGNPIGDKWTEAGILTTSEGNILYAGKGESSDNLLVGTGSGLLWTLEQDKKTATLNFTVDDRQFVVRNAYPIGDVSFTNSHKYSYAYLYSPVAKLENGKYYVLSFSTMVSDVNVSDFYLQVGFSSTNKGTFSWSSEVYYSNRDDSEKVHSTLRMLRYSKFNDGYMVRYYVIFQATNNYGRIRFVNRIENNKYTTKTATNPSTQSGIPGNTTASNDNDRTRVTKTYTGTKRTDGQYDVIETVTTLTATSSYFYLKKIQLEPAVNTDLENVFPSSYKEGQNTIESYIKQTVDSIEVYADNIIINADHKLALKTGTFTIDSDNLTVDGKGNVAVDGNIKARSGNIAGFKISGTGLTNDPFQNDAYVIFRNDAHKCFAGIGGNVLPTSTGLRAVARFENEDKDDWFQSSFGYNIAMYLSAKNAKYNFAFCGSGHGVLNGNIMGYGYQAISTNKDKITEIDLSQGNRVFATFASNSGVALPTLSNAKLALGLGSSTTHFALEITIIHLGGDNVAEHIYGKNNTVKDTADKHWMNNSEYPQLYNNDMGTIDSIKTGIGDVHTVMLFYDGINYKAFRVSYRD